MKSDLSSEFADTPQPWLETGAGKVKNRLKRHLKVIAQRSRMSVAGRAGMY
jgi:hypothetical protein